MSVIPVEITSSLKNPSTKKSVMVGGRRLGNDLLRGLPCPHAESLRCRGLCHPHWVDGYHTAGRSHDPTCPRRQQTYPVNASNGGQNLEQREGGDGGKKLLQLEGCCPNCQHIVSNPAESVEGGDKVLVLKPIYDLFKPERHDTVVFKYPLGPQKDFGAYNYIKRLWGLPGEKLAIHGGDVYQVDKEGKHEIIRKASGQQDVSHRVGL